jgi:A/G-specific adenine glycosylase
MFAASGRRGRSSRNAREHYGSDPDFSARVIAWQREHGRHHLPWQSGRDAYRIWLSEVMLQQTQVATVLPYFARFVDAFPDVGALAAAPIGRVLEHWSGLGYYRRAHHLHAAARQVVDRFGGTMPTDAATLATLPGIGRSTAAAIAAFASGERGAILDGNVKRVLARHAGIGGHPGAPATAALLWREAEARLPDAAADTHARPHDGAIEAYTQGLMDLGATLCTRSNPSCVKCPVAQDCVARAEGRVHELPSPRPRKALPERAALALVIVRDARVLFERRPETGVWSGLWSLPEARVEADAAHEATTRFDLHVRATHALPPLRHVFTHFALTLHPVRLHVDASRMLADGERHCWIERERLARAALPSPIRRIVQADGVTGPA